MSSKSIFSKKEIRFFEKWTIKRQRKWQYIGIVALTWGIVTGLINYFWSIDFQFREFDAMELALRLFAWSLGGILFGYFQFLAQDQRWKVYQERKKANSSSQT
ncbi:MAG: hypothetical protein AAF519_10210 [Bacteroidota bacterium]